MIEQILLIIITGVITALITYYFTSKTAEQKIKTYLKEHEDTCTKQSRIEKIEIEMKGGNNRFERIERALVWIVTQMGGNPFNLGFDK